MGLVWESFILAPGKGNVGMEPSSPPAFSVPKTDTVSAICPAIPAVPAAASLLISQILGFQVSDTLGLVDFSKEVLLNCGFLFDLLF